MRSPLRRFATFALAGAALMGAGCILHPHPGHLHVRVHSHAHAWVYYPWSGVYFCSAHRHYWYRDHRHVWLDVTVLPRHIELGASVEIAGAPDRPWQDHGHHERRYPPGQYRRDEAPGRAGTAPGRGGEGPPGRSGDAPGRAGEPAPGKGTPPGQGKEKEKGPPPGKGRGKGKGKG